MYKTSDLFFYIGITGVILFSFFSFSYAYYPFFNSDSALSVLMAYHYHLPEDIYCWGQNRGGTFEMMIAHFFISLFHSSPVITASIIHYLILIAGFFAGFHFIRKSFYRFALAVLWFFPSGFFIEIIIYQFSVQFSLFMIAIFFLSKSFSVSAKKNFFLSLSFLFMILNVWVLDLGIIPTTFLFLFLSTTILVKNNKGRATLQGIKYFSSKPTLFLSALWIVSGAAFIYWAKHLTNYTIGYSETSPNNPSEIYFSLLSISKSFSEAFLFHRKFFSDSMLVYSVAIFFVFYLFYFIKPKQTYSLVIFFRSFFSGNLCSGF